MPNPLQAVAGLRPDRLPNPETSAGAVVMELISKGKPPSVVLDFPRHDANGNPVCKVRLRRLTNLEMIDALANARQELGRLVKKGDELPWRPDEMEHNLRAFEILAVACRRVSYRCETHQGVKGFFPHKCPQCLDVMPEYIDSEKLDPPFFEYGSMEAKRYFDDDEMGVLLNSYATLKSQTHPELSELSVEEMRFWIKVIAEGLKEHPFSYFSREQLETLTQYCAGCVVELEARLSGLLATFSSPADSPRPSATTPETPPSESA